MNVQMVIVRIIHIGFGMFWAGSALFLAFVLEPSLRTLGPTIQRPVMGALSRLIGPLLGGSGVITIAAGTYLALRLRWGHLDTFFDTGWGWAILLGFVLAIAAMATGGMTGLQVARMDRIGREMEGRPPNPEELAKIQRISTRLRRLGRTTATLLLIVVVAMASAR